MMTALNRLLEGRRILVTGGARGLGYAFAQAIGRAGAHVVIADILAAVSYTHLTLPTSDLV